MKNLCLISLCYSDYKNPNEEEPQAQARGDMNHEGDVSNNYQFSVTYVTNEDKNHTKLINKVYIKQDSQISPNADEPRQNVVGYHFPQRIPPTNSEISRTRCYH